MGFRQVRARLAWSTLPRGMVGMLCLVAAVEGLITLRSAEIGSSHADHEATVALSTSAVAGDLLCFGDSLVKCGILPPVVEQRTGLRTYNLAIAGGAAPVSYAMLCRTLDQGAQPRAVVVDYECLLLATNVLGCQRALAEVAGPVQMLEYAWEVRKPDFVPYWFVHRALRSVRVRHEIRAAVLSALVSRERASLRNERVARRNWRENLGACVIPSGRKSVPIDQDPDARRLVETAWNPGPRNLDYIRRFVRRADEQGVPVVVVVPPLHPTVQARRFKLGLETQFDRQVIRLLTGLRNVTVLDGRRLALPASSYADAKHLNREGGVAFSQAVADVLSDLDRQSLRPGLVQLDRPTSTPGHMDVEDIDESVLALDGKAPVRR